MQRAARRIRGSGGASIRSVVTRAGNRTCSEQLVTSAALSSAVHVYPDISERRSPWFGHISSWHRSCKRYALSPVAAAGRWSLLWLSPSLSTVVDGARGVSWMVTSVPPGSPTDQAHQPSRVGPVASIPAVRAGSWEVRWQDLSLRLCPRSAREIARCARDTRPGPPLASVARGAAEAAAGYRCNPGTDCRRSRGR
jgi:hypothetical protein